MTFHAQLLLELLLLFHATHCSLLVPLSWKDVTEDERARRLQGDASGDANAFVRRQLSTTSLVFELSHGPENSPAAFENGKDGLVEGSLVPLPVCTLKGRPQLFRLHRSGVIPPSLQKKFPDVKSFYGLATNGSMSADVTVGPEGLRAQIWFADGNRRSACYIDPHTIGRTDKYTIYSYSDRRIAGPSGIPMVGGPRPGGRRMADGKASPAGSASRRLADSSHYVYNPPTGVQQIRTYRLCVAVSPDYITFATDRGTTAMAMLAATVARASGIWRRVLSISLQLCDDQDKLLKTADEGNKAPNGNPGAFLDSCTYYMESLGVSSDSYDLGHYISASGGGGLGACCACQPVHKCEGGTALSNPTGDAFDVDFFAHEMGHQFGHMHTFAGAKGSCGTNFYAGESVELGSGRTILSYAGICDSDNTDKNSLPYFHSVSLGIYARSQNDATYQGGSMMTCGSVTATSNHRPTAKSVGSCTIPKRTPFLLTGKGTDDDADILSYNWEQVDSAARPTPVAQESKEGPLFLSVPPSADGHTRHFPKLSTSIANRGTLRFDPLERLSTIQRDLHFTFTVRDQYDGPGGGNSDLTVGTWHASKTTVHVAASGPLRVLRPTQGNLETGAVLVEWELMGAKSKSDSGSVSLKAARYSVSLGVCDSFTCEHLPSWHNGYNEGCAQYELLQYCTSSGAAGPGWQSAWGDIASAVYQPDGVSYAQACCACGGGQRTCNPSTFQDLSNAQGEIAFPIDSRGVGRAKVMVPSELAGRQAIFAVSVSVSNETMTEEGTSCSAYAVSQAYNFSRGADASTVTKTLPAQGSVDVPASSLGVAFLMPADVILSATASTMNITVARTDTAQTIRTIPVTEDAVQVVGGALMVLVGDIGGSYEIRVSVDAGLVTSLPAQTLSFTTCDSCAPVAAAIVDGGPSNGTEGVTNTTEVYFTVSETSLPGPGSIRVFVHLPWYQVGYEEEICSIPMVDLAFNYSSMRAAFVLGDLGCLLYPDHWHRLQIDMDAFFNPLGGLPMAGNFSIWLKAEEDTVAPSVIQTYPVDGARNVSDADSVWVWFNEDVYASGAGQNITLTPQNPAKQTISLNVTDEYSVILSLIDDNVGEMLLWWDTLLQSRTTYDVHIPAGALTDWSMNPLPEYNFSFRTGDNWAPYCYSVSSEQAQAGGDLNMTVEFTDYADDVEQSQLVPGKAGNFWLQDLSRKTNVVSVPVSNVARVSIGGLFAHVSFPGGQLLPGTDYAFKWSDNIMLDDYDNPIFSSSHETNSLCNGTSFRTLGTPPAPTPAPTPGSTPAPTPAPTPGSTPAPTPAPTPGSTPASTPAPTPGSTPASTLAPTPGSTPASTPAPTPMMVSGTANVGIANSLGSIWFVAAMARILHLPLVCFS